MTFSIITPTYNCAEALPRTIRSVVEQGVADVQHVIVDGASTDETLAVVRASGSPLLDIHSGPDEGIYDAFNKGVALARGELVAFLNADDWYLPGALQAVEAYFLAHPETDLLHGNIEVQRGNRLEELRPRGGLSALGGVRLYHPTVFCRRSVFETVGGFDLGYPFCADLDWFLRVREAGCRFVHLDRGLTHFSLGGASTSNRAAVIDELMSIMKNHHISAWHRWSIWLTETSCHRLARLRSRSQRRDAT